MISPKTTPASWIRFVVSRGSSSAAIKGATKSGAASNTLKNDFLMVFLLVFSNSWLVI
jgi:hypothetical protein